MKIIITPTEVYGKILSTSKEVYGQFSRGKNNRISVLVIL